MADGSDLLVATDGGLRVYDGDARGWLPEVFLNGPAFDGGDLRTLAAAGGRAVAVTGGGRLVAFDGTALIGGTALTIPEDRASDARVSGGALYLAGAGLVQRYDPAERAVTGEWRVGGDRVSLVHVLDDGRPVSLAGGKVLVGGQPVAPEAGEVLSASVGAGALWTVRRSQGGARYLRSHPLDAGLPGGRDRCWFLQPTAGGEAGRILDAREVAPGWLLVATDDGPRFYSEAGRRWFGAAGALDAPVDRVHSLGSHLLLVAGNRDGRRLLPVDRSDLAEPDGCAPSAVGTGGTWRPAASLAVDEASGKAAWLGPDGALFTWQDGVERAILAGLAEAPAAADLRRVFRAGDVLAFATDDGLAAYHVATGAWTRVALRVGDREISRVRDLTLEPAAGGWMLTALEPGGRVLAGAWDGKAAAIALQAIAVPDLPAFGRDGGAILDVVAGDDLWTFVMEDRIRRFDPRGRRFAPDVVFPTRDRSRRLVERGSTLVVEEADGTVWWVPATDLPTEGPAVAAGQIYRHFVRSPDEPTLLTQGRDVVRLQASGAVQFCDARNGYACRDLIPAAMALDPGRVRAALRHRDRIVFDTADGVRLYDEGRRSEVRLGPGIDRLTRVTAARAHGLDLWLLDDAGTLARFGPSDGGRVMLDAVTALVTDHDGRLWIRRADGDALWDGDGPLGLAEEVGRLLGRTPAGASPLAAGVAQGGRPWLVDAERRPATLQRDRAHGGARLPAGIDPAGIRALGRDGPAGRWWVQAGDALIRLEETWCPAPMGSGDAAAAELAAATAAGTRPQCLVERSRIDLPETWRTRTAVRASVLADGGVSLDASDGAVLTLRPNGAGFDTVAERAADAPPGVITDTWPSLRARMGQRRDGVTAFEPVTDLEAAVAEVEGVSTRPYRLTSATLPQPVQVPALDTGWLRWDRPLGRFTINGPDGGVSVAPEAFVRDGRFLFAGPGMAVAAADAVLFANAAGIWRYPTADMDLTDGRIGFRPLDLPGLRAAAHGRFLLDAGSIPYDGTAIEPDQDRFSIAEDDATWTEALRARRVDAALTVAGAPVPAGADRGFAWDRREEVAFDGSRLVVQTPLGILEAGRLEAADPGPAGALPVAGRIRGLGAEPYLERSDGWFRRTATGWETVAGDPSAAWEMVSNRRWGWRGAVGSTEIHPAGTAHGFAVLGRPLGFTSDQLAAAAAQGDALAVMTSAYFEMGPPAAWKAGSAARYAPEPLDRLDPAARSPGTTVLYGRRADVVLRWDNQAFGIVPPAQNPFADALLMDHPRLRVQRTAGRIRAEVKVDDPGGGPGRWLPVSWVGGFPFDRVTTAAGGPDGRLYTGTHAGLLVHAAPSDTGLSGITLLYPMGLGDRLSPVTAMGTPVASPSVLAARSDALCLVFDAAGRHAPCDGPALADVTVRAESPTWSWHRRGTGVTGTYLDATGQPLGRTVDIRDGRFAHDRITDLAACGSHFAAAWADGWMTLHADAGLDLARAGHWPLPEPGGRLYCLERPIREGGLALEPGLYHHGPQATHRFAGGWQPLPGAGEREAIALRSEGRLPVDRDRLRLMRPAQGPVRFEQRRLDGTWLPLAWKGPRLDLDAVDRITLSDGRIWAATGAGLAPFVDIAGTGTFGFDPDGLVVVREPGTSTQPCRVDDIAMQDDGTTLLRCDGRSDRVHSGRLTTQADAGVFVPFAQGDPFAEQVMVGWEGAYWRWWRTGHANGGQGSLVFELHSEPGTLSAGRFSFDGIVSLRSIAPGRLDIATEEAGWFRSDSGDLHLRHQLRPSGRQIEASKVRRLAAVELEGRPLLCLQLDEGAVLADASGGIVEQRDACHELLGRDAHWRYLATSEGVRMETADRRQRRIERRLAAGRFADDRATGLPVAVRRNGAVDHLVPTAAGILALDDEGRTVGHYGPPFDGLDPDAVPSVLALPSQTGPAYLAGNGLVGLDDDRTEPLAGMEELPLPGVTALEPGPAGRWRIRWGAGNGAWALLPASSGRPPPAGVVPVDVADWPRFIRHRTVFGDPAPYMLVQVDGGDVRLVTERGQHALGLERKLAPVTALRWKDRLYVVERSELLELDLAGAMVQAFGIASEEPGSHLDERDKEEAPTTQPPAPSRKPTRPSTDTGDGPAPQPRPTPGSPAPEAPSTAPAHPLSAADIQELQRNLASLGLDPGPADGKLGPRTLRALDALYQSLDGTRPSNVNSDVLELTRELLRVRGQ